MNTWDRIKNVFVDQTVQRVYMTIPSDHVFPPLVDEPFLHDSAYLRVWINDMYLFHRRVLYQARYPAIHAFCRFLYAGEKQEAALVVSSGQIESLKSALDRVVNLNHRMLGPIPFRGGDVEILLGLIAVEAADYGSQLLNVLSSLSELAGKGEFKLALNLLQPLKSGVDSLFGLDKVKLHLGIHDVFTAGDSSPQSLRPGYRVVIDASADEIESSQLWVKRGRLHTGKDSERTKPFDQADYLLFYIERLEERDDWQVIDSVKKAWDKTIESAYQSYEDEGQLAFKAFSWSVLSSDDLIWSDKVRLIDTLSKRVKAIQTMKSRRQFASTIDTDIDTCLRNAIPVEDARRMDRKTILNIALQ